MVDEYGCKFGIGDWWRKIPNRSSPTVSVKFCTKSVSVPRIEHSHGRMRCPSHCHKYTDGSKAQILSMSSCTKELFGVKANPSAWNCLYGKRDQYKGFRFDAQKERNQFKE